MSKYADELASQYKNIGILKKRTEEKIIHDKAKAVEKTLSEVIAGKWSAKRRITLKKKIRREVYG